MKEMLEISRKERYSVGAFNILNYLTAKAVIEAAEELKSPLILQTSVSTVKTFGAKQLIGMLKLLVEDTAIPVAVHLDHCTDKELAMKCIDEGWSSVMYDGSKLPLAENIKITKEIVAYAKKKNVTVEGELGAIVGVEDNVAVKKGEESLATLHESKEFLASTGIDAYAPAIGTAHGLYKDAPKISFELFESIEKISPCPLVIHGGTGLDDDTFRRLIALGGAKINISTAVKIAYVGGIKEFLANATGSVDPLKLDKYSAENVKRIAKEHISLFGSENKA